MRYVILRDDDTNALTPVECLERLYRPFLDRGMPVNLATIPKVRTDTTGANGLLEGYLVARDRFSVSLEVGRSIASAPLLEAVGVREFHFSTQLAAPGISACQPPAVPLSPSPKERGSSSRLRVAHDPSRNGNGQSRELLPLTIPIAANEELVRYLRGNPGYHIVQHGYHHSMFEFDSERADDVCHRLDRGRQLLSEAGFPEPKIFVAPYDRLSRISLGEVAKRFRVLSTGWFERRRLPASWWPRYALKKVFRRPHWRVGHTLLLTHPGCLLSYQRPYVTMIDEVKHAVASRRLTVLVTHWWEYFRGKKPDERFIQILHETAAWLASQPDIKVVSFDDVASGEVPLK